MEILLLRNVKIGSCIFAINFKILYIQMFLKFLQKKHGMNKICKILGHDWDNIFALIF